MLSSFRIPLRPAILGLAALALSASAALAAGAVTTADTQVFDGPLPHAGLITVIPGGTRVGILWCGASPQWCLINFHKTEGFVSAAALQLPGAGPFGGALGHPVHPGTAVSDIDAPRTLAESNAGGGGGGSSGMLQAHDFGSSHTTTTSLGSIGGGFLGHGTGPIKIGK